MVRVSRSAAGLGSFAVDVALLRPRMKDDDDEAGAASTPMMMGEERGPMIPDVASWDQRNKHVILGRSMVILFINKSTSCQSNR